MANTDLSRISGHTRPIAILGYPIHHSLSPAIHNAAFAAARLDYVYLALEVHPRDIVRAIQGIKAMDFAGLNLTAPHKETAIPLLDEITDTARAVGAVNTVSNRSGRWIGTNTDPDGFRRMLELHGLYRQGMKSVLLGSGGAARSGLFVLNEVSSQVTVFNRTLSRAEQLLQSMEAVRRPDCRWEAQPLDMGALERCLAEADLLVNGTSLGMYPNVDGCPLPDGVKIPSRCGVAEMIYAPPRTRLMREAEENGATAVGGLEMLLYQAVESFSFWTGVGPDLRVMEEVLNRAARPLG